MTPAGAGGRGQPRRSRIALMVIVGLVVLAADQITKTIAVHDLAGHGVHLFGPFSLQLSYNTGIAFSLGTGLTVPIVIIAVVLIGTVVWFARGVPTTGGAIAIGLIVGGALGNLADRLFRGHSGGVVDFIASTFWPTFNIADASIVCGCGLLVAGMLRSGRPRPSPDNASTAGAGSPDGAGEDTAEHSSQDAWPGSE